MTVSRVTVRVSRYPHPPSPSIGRFEVLSMVHRAERWDLDVIVWTFIWINKARPSVFHTKNIPRKSSNHVTAHKIFLTSFLLLNIDRSVQNTFHNICMCKKLLYPSEFSFRCKKIFCVVTWFEDFLGIFLVWRSYFHLFKRFCYQNFTTVSSSVALLNEGSRKNECWRIIEIQSSQRNGFIMLIVQVYINRSRSDLCVQSGFAEFYS